MELREYQRRGIEKIEENFHAGIQRQILCMPTGAGKTFTFAALAKEYLDQKKKVMILTDRRELLKQTFESFLRLHKDLQAQLIQAKEKKIVPASLYIAMVETLHNRLKTQRNKMALSYGRDVDLLIIDECHKGNFRKILDLDTFKNSRVLGVTATPLNNSKKHPLKESFQTIVSPVTVQELIEQGALLPCKTFGAIEEIHLKKNSVGEYTDDAQQEYFDKSIGYDEVIKQYREHADGTKALVFCINKEHTIETFKEFARAGYRSSWVLSGEECNREHTLDKFAKTDEIQVLCNCGILTTGYDNPSIETIILNRKTSSLPLYNQTTGRGSRQHHGKTHFNIIDMFSNFKQHGQWDSPRDWKDKFENPPKPGKAPTKKCPECKSEVPASTRICPGLNHSEDIDSSIIETICGYEFPEPETKDKELKKSTQFVEIPKNLFAPQKSVYAMDIQEIIEYGKDRGYKKMWGFHQVRKRGKYAVEEWAESVGYKPGWVEMQEKLRKQALWEEIKCLNMEGARITGEYVKSELETKFNNDFFRAENYIRKDLGLPPPRR